MIETLKVIVGPTSSGKTTLALEVCKRENGVIVSADSRQIYKGMDIGTGKIPLNNDVVFDKGDNKWTLDGIDVWGYDMASPDMYFSAFDYAEFAINKLNELREQPGTKTIILAGGTGFYIDAVTERVKLEGSEPDFELRAKLEAQTLEELRISLMSLNLNVYENIDKDNKVRLVRAIEKEMNRNKTKRTLPRLNFKNIEYVGLTAERPLLYRKTDEWLESVWDNGLIEETHELMRKYPGSEKLKGLVYKDAVSFINGAAIEENAVQKAKYDLHAYIRRQQTWFRKNPDISWIDVSDKILL